MVCVNLKFFLISFYGTNYEIPRSLEIRNWGIIYNLYSIEQETGRGHRIFEVAFEF